MASSRQAGIEVNLSCAICKTILKEPRITPCRHSFCRSCLETFLQSIPISNSELNFLSTSDTLQQPGLPSPRFEFTCPYPDCGRKYRLRTADIDEFPPSCMVDDSVKGCIAKEREVESRCGIRQMNLACSAFTVSLLLTLLLAFIVRHSYMQHCKRRNFVSKYLFWNICVQ